jgi:hypothetical protein
MMVAMDEPTEQRRRRVERTDAALQALGLHPAGELLPGLKVWTDPEADPNLIRFVSPSGVDSAEVTLSPQFRVRFID